jgi:hypothetical protein
LDGLELANGSAKKSYKLDWQLQSDPTLCSDAVDEARIFDKEKV